MPTELVRSSNSAIGDIYTVKLSTGFNIAVGDRAFGNCQSFIIRDFKYVIDYLLKDDNLGNIIREIKTVCNISRPFLVVDLNRVKYNKIRKMLKFVSKSFYTNANGSPMVLCNIDTREVIA